VSEYVRDPDQPRDEVDALIAQAAENREENSRETSRMLHRLYRDAKAGEWQ